MIEAACLRATQRLRLELTLHWHRLLRFSLVGASGLIVNNVVLFWQIEILHWRPVPGAVVATECAIFSNFVLNDRWTFADSPKPASWLRRLVSYNALTLGGLVLSVAVLALLHYGVRLHYLPANLVAIAAGTAWNYGSNRYWTWSGRGPGTRWGVP